MERDSLNLVIWESCDCCMLIYCCFIGVKQNMKHDEFLLFVHMIRWRYIPTSDTLVFTTTTKTICFPQLIEGIDSVINNKNKKCFLIEIYTCLYVLWTFSSFKTFQHVILTMSAMFYPAKWDSQEYSITKVACQKISWLCGILKSNFLLTNSKYLLFFINHPWPRPTLF